MLINDRFDLTAELAAARVRVLRVIDRTIHFASRSAGQRRRQLRARLAKNPGAFQSYRRMT